MISAALMFNKTGKTIAILAITVTLAIIIQMALDAMTATIVTLANIAITTNQIIRIL
jgi:hypothetical protein